MVLREAEKGSATGIFENASSHCWSSGGAEFEGNGSCPGAGVSGKGGAVEIFESSKGAVSEGDSCGPGAGESGDGDDSGVGPGGEEVLWGGVIARSSGESASGSDQGG
jgi:hypothetical protein